MKVLRLIATAALAPITVLGMASTASAEPGKGATVTTQRECRTTPFGFFCVKSLLVVNETDTPSGNVSYTANHHFQLENNFRDCQFLAESRTHRHFLLQDGELQEAGEHEESSLTANCPGTPSTICTFTVDYHYANGTIQYETTDFVCTPT